LVKLKANNLIMLLKTVGPLLLKKYF
jgi:hypothetical protein